MRPPALLEVWAEAWLADSHTARVKQRNKNVKRGALTWEVRGLCWVQAALAHAEQPLHPNTMLLGVWRGSSCEGKAASRPSSIQIWGTGGRPGQVGPYWQLQRILKDVRRLPPQGLRLHPHPARINRIALLAKVSVISCRAPDCGQYSRWPLHGELRKSAPEPGPSTGVPPGHPSRRACVVPTPKHQDRGAERGACRRSWARVGWRVVAVAPRPSPSAPCP
ncbi:hypothetical protein F751_3568 [Auxenochlorella protothecoides]|uniref:Uncharacterized protein n=1 Tax=Auxenochlorella protothecoides TaxID=3075 RepID=A0A087SSN4_AUXPR|nr:hypothetical protein F751_3568 [Auxenochlorella protothecoides]KFM28738.1 hypothetical protein F751_3568 [Auxenochlorella protothecoides]